MSEQETEKQPHVLIVEMNRVVSEYYKRHLQSVGYSVVEKNTCIEALQYMYDIREPLPQIVITEQFLPQMTGLQMVERMKLSINTEIREIPILMCSILDDRDNVVKYYAHGVDLFLPKPIDQYTLIAVVRLMTKKL